MKPAELLRSSMEAVVAPPLHALGFRFARSRCGFFRKVGGVRQNISIASSWFNSEDDCRFWSMWGANSSQYRRWYQAEWGSPPTNDALGGCADWNIPGWTRDFTQRFNLRRTVKDEGELAAFVDNIQRAGIPFLERISTWRGAADDLVAHQWMFDRAADFMLIAGDRERAEEILRSGIRTFTEGGRVDAHRELPRLTARLARYFDGPQDARG